MAPPPANRCSYLRCLSNSRNNKDLAFFRFPKDELRCREWIINSGRLEFLEKENYVEYCYANRRICSKHFKKEMIREVKSRKFPTLLAVPEKVNDPRAKIPVFEQMTLTSVNFGKFKSAILHVI